MSKIRVLFVNHAVTMGGAEHALLGMLTWLDRERFEPGLALPSEGPLAEEARKIGVEVHLGYPSPRLLNVKRRSLGEDKAAILAYPFDMAVSIARMVLLIKRGRYDVVMSNSAKAHIYGSISGWAAGRPAAWRLHDILTAEAFSSFNISIFKFCAKRFVTRVVAASEAIANAVAAFGVPRSKLVAIFNGIDIDSIAADSAAGLAVREELGISPDAPVAGIIGRLIEWKGVDYFIKAASLVAEALPDARFLAVGDALYGEQAYVDSLEKLCRDLGLKERLIFTGFREDIPAILSAIDVLVYASVQPEPSGLGVNEAMASSRPVVGTDHGGIPELLEDGVSGILIPPRDEKAMADALIELLSNNRAKARSMGDAALVWAREQFDPARQMRAIEDQFLEMLCASR
jgi:glycosyltransferase involved in cell wall biosynthesis